MIWNVFLYLSVGFLLLAGFTAFVLGKIKYKAHIAPDITKILFAGVILSATMLFIPIYVDALRETSCGIFETVLSAIHNMIRLFIVDGEFEFVAQHLDSASGWVARCYSIIFAVLFVAAPLLTFSFVLSFFKNASAYKTYFTHFWSEVYVFSALNEKSFHLAEDIKSKKPNKRMIIFTDVFEKQDETYFELQDKAKKLGAIFFVKDVSTVKFGIHSRKKNINFFAISDDPSENITNALEIIKKYRYRKNTNLYVFSTQVEAEMLLAKGYDDKTGEKQHEIQVRKVNDVRALVTRELYENGYENVFCSAVEDENGIKNIGAVVIGMGLHGTEMVKNLAWLGQMTGYRITIDAFDIDPLAEEKFTSLCPELMKEGYNGNFTVADEAQYKITVHSGVNVDSKSFDDALNALPHATYVFVAMGEDEKNISVAIKLRTLFERSKIHPVIQSIVYDSERNAAMQGITNYKSQPYDIDFIGDIKTCYSEDVIIRADIEQVAKKRHMAWGADEISFFKYDYNYKSSIASAIHRRMKELCGIAGITKPANERTDAEKQAIRVLEHNRWNAYMRSEGYVYGGTPEPEGRNDLAKMHNCLVRFELLSPEDKAKDDD